jgi:TonB-dependent starch-binding outer membrane protein SusC
MKNYKKYRSGSSILLLSLMMIMFFPAVMFAQKYNIMGKVVDVQSQPIIGAYVLINNTKIGTVTDVNGEFLLSSPTKNCVLTVKMIGYKTAIVNAASGRKLSIKLVENISEIGEVVVIGYGTVAKKDLTGAVGVLSSKDLANMPVTSVNNVLQGKVPGLTVISSSGAPGRGSVTHIRGIGSISGSTTPLYIVDGLPQDGIDYLNPDDIESITVHKDASVAAIYGSRGSNGIIIVTTKTGTKDSKISVNYDGYVGWQSPWKRPHMLNAADYITYKNLAADNAGQARVPAFATQSDIDTVLNFVTKNTGPNGTDWWKEITDNGAFMQSQNVSINGGSKNVGILSSLSYMDQNGLIKGSNYNRISWRNNFNAQISKDISLTGNLGIINEKRKLIDENNPATGTIFSAMGADPITPVFRNNLVDVPLSLNQIYNGYEPNNVYSQYSGILFSNKRNPVAQIERMKQSKYENLFIKGGANLEIKFLEFFKSNSRFGFDIVRSYTSGFQPKYTLNSNDYANDNTVVENNSRSNYFVGEQTLSFDRTFGQFKVSALVGMSAEKTDVSSVNASIQGVINNDKDMAILNAGTTNPMVSGYPYSNSLLSYFGRVMLDYQSKYILAANIRRDGSSKFAKGHKWGTFPSISAAWRFTDEPFMQSTRNWFYDGKLRVSYGEIGNQNIGGGAYVSTYGSTIYDHYNFGDPNTSSIGSGIISLGNPVLKWETSKQFDIGLDLAFFNDHLELTADYFRKTIDDMLMQEPQPTTLGFPTDPYSNVGSMRNTGWEFAVTYRNKLGDLDYSVNANISTYSNKVLSLGNGDAIYGSAYLNNTITKTEVGRSVGYFYGYVTNGIFQNAAQVEGGPQRETAKPGDIRFKDLNNDDVLDASDRTKIGSPWPDFVYGLTLNAMWKGFDFSMFVQGSQGNDVMNMTLYDFESGTGYMNAKSGFLKRAWNGEGSTDKYHRISADQGQNQLVSDYFVEDGSYLRIKNLQFGYNFCDHLFRVKGINSMRLYVSVQNLLTLTKYSGLDPEIGSSNATLNGIDQGFYPQSRTWTIGLNLKF